MLTKKIEIISHSISSHILHTNKQELTFIVVFLSNKDGEKFLLEVFKNENLSPPHTNILLLEITHNHTITSLMCYKAKTTRSAYCFLFEILEDFRMTQHIINTNVHHCSMCSIKGEKNYHSVNKHSKNACFQQTKKTTIQISTKGSLIMASTHVNQIKQNEKLNCIFFKAVKILQKNDKFEDKSFPTVFSKLTLYTEYFVSTAFKIITQSVHFLKILNECKNKIPQYKQIFEKKGPLLLETIDTFFQKSKLIIQQHEPFDMKHTLSDFLKCEIFETISIEELCTLIFLTPPPLTSITLDGFLLPDQYDHCLKIITTNFSTKEQCQLLEILSEKTHSITALTEMIIVIQYINSNIKINSWRAFFCNLLINSLN